MTTDKEKSIYKKEIQIRDWDYLDYSEGRIILDWIPEEKWDKQIPKYRFKYRIFERFVKV